MATSALEPMAAGIFQKLNVAALKTGISGLTVTIRDYVPQPAPFPFLVYSLSEKDISGLGQGNEVKQVQLRLYAYTQTTITDAQRIMAVAIGLLQFIEPTVTGWQVPAVGRPNDVIEIEASEINGVACREVVSIWDCFAKAA